jgi:2-polyprenyl-3-methyl-5-hydroxy-6-metoxy-1,4-benzoquinol methylase
MNKNECLKCNNPGKKYIFDDEIYYCKNCYSYYYIKKIQRQVTFGHEDFGNVQADTRGRYFKNIFDYLESQNNELDVIEIGAGFGGYIQHAKSQGHNCTAIDLNTSFKHIFDKQGINFIELDVEDFNIKLTQNVVIMSHILEHLKNPLDSLKKILNENVEYLLIEVPNSNGIIFKFSKLLLLFKVNFLWNRLWQKNSTSPHLFYFSDNTFKDFEAKLNLKIEKTFPTRFSTFKDTYMRTRATENLIISLISIFAIQIFELINLIFGLSENKCYIMKNLNYVKRLESV